MSAVTKSRWFAIASAIKARYSIILLIGLSFLSFACSPVQDTNVRTPARESYTIKLSLLPKISFIQKLKSFFEN